MGFLSFVLLVCFPFTEVLREILLDITQKALDFLGKPRITGMWFVNAFF